MDIKVGIIGGTNLDSPDIIKDRKELSFEPQEVDLAKNGKPADYSIPSGSLISGCISGVECILLARHGANHSVNPTNVSYRANLLALQQLGCNVVLAMHAVGSLKEEFAPGHFVVLEQVIDRTTKRDNTYYDGAESSWKGVCHIPFSDPYDASLRTILHTVGESIGITIHSASTLVCIEGPRFSSRAESKMFQLWGADTIGMTEMPEVALANELGIPFAAVGMITDYDCWRQGEEAVSVENVMRVAQENNEKFIKLLNSAVVEISKQKELWSGPQINKGMFPGSD